MHTWQNKPSFRDIEEELALEELENFESAQDEIDGEIALVSEQLELAVENNDASLILQLQNKHRFLQEKRRTL
jgi:hypothetical protein